MAYDILLLLTKTSYLKLHRNAMYLSIDSVHIVNNDVIWENLATVEETLRTKSLFISFMPRS